MVVLGLATGFGVSLSSSKSFSDPVLDALGSGFGGTCESPFWPFSSYNSLLSTTSVMSSDFGLIISSSSLRLLIGMNSAFGILAVTFGINVVITGDFWTVFGGSWYSLASSLRGGRCTYF